MTKRFNFKYLQQLCSTREIKLLDNYTDENLMSQTFIKFECVNCKEHTTKQFINIEKYNALCKNCSNKYGKQKAKQTILSKYGVDNISQMDEIKKKKKETTFINYGVYHNSQCQKIKDKKIATCLKNHGVEHPQQLINIRHKSKQTCLNNYGVEHNSQCQEIKDKKIATCLKNHGVEHPSQNQEIAEKSFKNGFNVKSFVFPSGNKITCQGYEPFALQELISINIDEHDIITGCKNVPTIWYNDENGKNHRHYVDIFIPSKNTCIEVKSSWTILLKSSNIFEKQRAAKEAGYDYEIWVYDKNGNKLDVYE